MDAVAEQPRLTLSSRPNLRVMEVAGGDAEAFLNAQLSQNVHGTPGRAPLAAWHDARGRVLALVRVLRVDEGWLLLADGADMDGFLSRLGMFVLRDDVRLADVSEAWRGATALGDLDGWLRSAHVTLGASAGDTATVNGVSLIRVSPEITHLLARPEALSKIDSGLEPPGSPAGELAEIRLGLVGCAPELAGRYTPQMLDLDRLGALAFDKGCYPGQEVIARIQNLGSVKRRLFRFAGQLREVPPLGSALIDSAGTELGDVVRSVRADDRRVDLLAVVRTELADRPLACAAEPEIPLEAQPLPGREAAGRH